MQDDPPVRLILTDEPYNVKISGHVTGGQHREFVMASGENDRRRIPHRQRSVDGGSIALSLRRRNLRHLHRLARLPTVDSAAASPNSPTI